MPMSGSGNGNGNGATIIFGPQFRDQLLEALPFDSEINLKELAGIFPEKDRTHIQNSLRMLKRDGQAACRRDPEPPRQQNLWRRVR